MSGYYDLRFYEWVNTTARRSAQLIVPIVQEQCQPNSVIDVGCGQGAWLEQWSKVGVTDFFGIDGSHVDREMLLIPRDCFADANLIEPLKISRRFEIAQSLEVAEHLPRNVGPAFVAMLTSLSDIVLFSAARPGQGGEGHVNERQPSYWAKQFGGFGYAAFDSVRPLVAPIKRIDPWYRYNIVLYANETGIRRLSAFAREKYISKLSNLDTVGDWKWQLRCAALRPLPEKAVTCLSRLRYRLANMALPVPCR
jgi:hypothetical protein